MDTLVEVREISAQETHGVRHSMLRQGRPIEDCVFHRDEEESTLHLGAFKKDEIIGVASAYQNQHANLTQKTAYQIRGVAVLNDHQRNGIGHLLMSQMERILGQKKVEVIWLNARIAALKFYESLHYTQEGNPFEIAEIGTHYYFYKELK